MPHVRTGARSSPETHHQEVYDMTIVRRANGSSGPKGIAGGESGTGPAPQTGD